MRKIKRTTGTSSTILEPRTYVDPETGEEILAVPVIKKVVNANFRKVWVGDLVDIMRKLNSAKMDVLSYFLDQMDTLNRVVATLDEIAIGAGVSKRTAQETIKILLTEGFMQRERNGRYLINPDITVFGTAEKHANILIRYRAVENTQQEEKIDSKAVVDSTI